MRKNKIGIIGDKDSILGFKALGVDVFPVTEEQEAEWTLKRMAREDYAVILITEQVAVLIKNTVDRYKTSPFPVVLSIPNNMGTTGQGMENVKANALKAIGSDIIFGNK